MAEATRALAVQLTNALPGYRRPLAAGVGTCSAILIAALAIPVGLPDADVGKPGSRLGGEPLTLAPAEDLSAFAGSIRWGGLTFDELERQRLAAEAGGNADAARRDRTGFVGTTATPDDRVVLLMLPSGEVARVPAGGALPDGRKVSDITDTTTTLSDTGGDEELELFPRPPEGIVGEALVPSRPDPTPEP